MKDTLWRILDDMKMNLIAAFIVLLLSANFTPVVKFPFKLVEVKQNLSSSGMSRIRSTKVMIFKKNGELVVGFKGNEFPLKDAESGFRRLNPALPVILAVEKESSLTSDQLIRILGLLKARGVRYVSVVAQKKF